MPPRLVRIATYVAVGGTVALLYSGVTAVLHAVFNIPPIVSSVFAFALTLPVSYFGHSRITFRDSVRDKMQWARFTAIAVAALIVSSATMYWIVYVVQAPFWIALVLNWGVIPVVNYAISLLWTFRFAGPTAQSEPKETR